MRSGALDVASSNKRVAGSVRVRSPRRAWRVLRATPATPKRYGECPTVDAPSCELSLMEVVR